MSRYFGDYDDDTPEGALATGRWQHNSRTALKGKRGRKAIAELREALLALPEKRLIKGAVCTVGGVDRRLPPVTEEETRDKIKQMIGLGCSAAQAESAARWQRQDREREREKLAGAVEEQGGEGVCLIGAYLWYRQVKAGASPAEAFDALPLLFDGMEDGSDTLHETAEAGRDAGLTYTLAWTLAFRNDENYQDMTPEERYTAFLAWISTELGDTLA